MSVKSNEESAVNSCQKKLKELNYTNPDTVVEHAIQLMTSYNSLELSLAVIERRGNRDELIKLHGKVTITPITDQLCITGALTVWIEKNFPSQAPIVNFTQTNFPEIYFEPFLDTKLGTVLYSPFYKWADSHSTLLDLIGSITIHLRQVCLGWILSARDQEDPNFSIPPRLSLPTGFQTQPLPIAKSHSNTLDTTPIGARPIYLNANQMPPNFVQNPQIPPNPIQNLQMPQIPIQNPQMPHNSIQNPIMATIPVQNPIMASNVIRNPQMPPNFIRNPQIPPNPIHNPHLASNSTQQIIPGSRPMLPQNPSIPMNEMCYPHNIPPFPQSMYPVMRQTSSQDLAPSYVSIIGPVSQHNYPQSIPNSRPPQYSILPQQLSPPNQQQQQQQHSPMTPNIISTSSPIQQQQQQQQQDPQNGILTSPISPNTDSPNASSPRNVPASARKVIPKTF